MADLDRQLPFREYQPNVGREPKTFVALIYAILTQPTMLVAALMLMNSFLSIIAVLIHQGEVAALTAVATVATVANVTLLVWYLLRVRADKKATTGRRDGNGAELDPMMKE